MAAAKQALGLVPVWLKTARLGAVLFLVGAPAHAQPGYGAAQSNASRDTAMKSLHDALHLTAAQEPAWATYAAQMTSGTQARGRQEAAQRMMPTLDAPHRMDLIEAEMRQELADLHSRSAALKTLYTALTPAQRKTFDQKTLPAESDQGSQ